MNVRIHLALHDNDPMQHERTIMFLECNQTLPDDVDLDEYARSLRVVATVQDPLNSEHDAELVLGPYGI